MLVISRKPDESVVVGGESGFDRVLKITVVEIGDGCVTLAIDAEKCMPIQAFESWPKTKNFQPFEHRRMRAEVVEGRRRWLARSRSGRVGISAPLVGFGNLWRETTDADEADDSARLNVGFALAKYRKSGVH